MTEVLLNVTASTNKTCEVDVQVFRDEAWVTEATLPLASVSGMGITISEHKRMIVREVDVPEVESTPPMPASSL